MENMSKMRELFHGLPNHFNAISTISFTLADTLENSNEADITAENDLKHLQQINEELNAIEESYLLSCSDVKRLSRIIDEELGLKEETAEDFVRIGKLLNSIDDSLRMSQEILKVSSGKTADSMISLTKELYSFEDNCIELGRALRKIKSYLIAIGKYNKS